MNSDRMRDLLALSDLKRWNVIPTTKDQTVGQHTFRVAVIAWEIVERYNRIPAKDIPPPVCRINIGDLLMASLMDDGAECLTGDQPSNLKRILKDKGINWTEVELDLCPWLADNPAGPVTHGIIKIADKIESGAWLSLYGAHGTNTLVIELKFQAHRRAIELDELAPGIMKVAMDVAGEVWNNEWPVVYSKKKKEIANGIR